MKRSTLGIRRSKIKGRPKLDLEVCRKHHSRPMGRVGFVFCSLISVSIEIFKKNIIIMFIQFHLHQLVMLQFKLSSNLNLKLL